MTSNAPPPNMRTNDLAEPPTSRPKTNQGDDDDDVPRNGQRRVTMKTVRIAEVVYDVRQYWGLRKLLIDVLILACHFLASNFTYQPLSGESRAYAQQVLVTAIVNGVPDNRPNPMTLFDAGTLSEAMEMLCASLTYWGQASYGPDDNAMYLGQIDPLNQCDWGTEVTYPPLCYRDDPLAEAEFTNTTRWVRVTGEEAAPRARLVRWWYPTGESAGTLHEGFKHGVTPKPDLHFPILLDHFNRTEYQERVDLLASKADLIASYSKFLQLFVVTEHVLTGEMSHQRIAFDRSIPPMDSGMLFAATTPRLIVWNSASPIFSWPERPGVAQRPQRLATAFHAASNVLMFFILRDIVNRFLAIRHHRRCVRRLQAQHFHYTPSRREVARAMRRDNIEALLVILRPFSWTSFDVCVLFYGLVFENVILNAILLVPPFAEDTGRLTVADVLQITMHSNSCVVWICSDGVFVACLFFRLFESVFKFRRLAMYVRVFELAFGQFKDYAVIFLSLLMCGSLGFSFVCQGLGGGAGFSSYSAAVNSWSLFVFRFYDYRTFSQDGKWVGFGLPLMGIAFFWVAVVLCVIFSQNIILAVIMAAHNAAVGELEESYGLDCQVSFAMYCLYRAFQSVGRLFSVAAALFVRGGRRRRTGGVGYAIGGLVHDLRCLIHETRARGIGWIHFHNGRVVPLPHCRDHGGGSTRGGAAVVVASGQGGVNGSVAVAGSAALNPHGSSVASGELRPDTAMCPPERLFGSDAAVPAAFLRPPQAPGSPGGFPGVPPSKGSSALLSQMRLGLSGKGDQEDPLEKDVHEAATAFGLAPSSQPLEGGQQGRGLLPWFRIQSSDQMHQCLSRWELIEEAAPILLRLVEFYTNPASGRLHDRSPFSTVLARQDPARRGLGVGFGGGGAASAVGFGEQEIPSLSASLDAHEMALLFNRMRILMDLGEDYQPISRQAPTWLVANGSRVAGGGSHSHHGGASAGGSHLSQFGSTCASTVGGTARSSTGTGAAHRSALFGGGSDVGSVSVSSPGLRGGGSAMFYDRHSARSAGGGWGARHLGQRPSDEELRVAKRLQKLYGSVPTNSTRKPGVQLSTLGQMASIQGQMHRIQRPLRERGWDSFICYSRENAEGQVSELRLDLLMVGHRAWVDLYENSSPEGLFQGIMQSDMFILYLTRGVLSHLQTQLELAAALEARKLIVLVRECRSQVFYQDHAGEFHNTCASVTEVVAESPAEFRPVFEACLALEATDYKDVSERRLFIEHLTGGKNAHVVDIDPETLFKWTKIGGEFESGFESDRHMTRLSEEGDDLTTVTERTEPGPRSSQQRSMEAETAPLLPPPPPAAAAGSGRGKGKAAETGVTIPQEQ